jgi:uncharacterized protein (DUF4415 family)
MSAKERDLQRSLGSDLDRVDAHAITPAEYEESPELGDEFFARAKLHEGGRRLDQESDSSKQEVTLAIDRHVFERFRATGADWPERVKDALRAAAKHLL